MANRRLNPTKTSWTSEYDTLRRENLFRNPPNDRTAYPALQEAVHPHIESFNALLNANGLLDHALRDIGTKQFTDAVQTEEGPNVLSVRIAELYVEKAQIPSLNKHSTRNREIFPAECRERHATYRGKFRARVEFKVNDGEWRESIRELGQLPIMLKSTRCHLEKLSPAQLVHAKEESEELGGYFVVNGIEKLIRMLILPRRNFPTALVRPSFANRGPTYTKFGMSIRSVRPDQSSQSNVLHYLNDGNVTFRFSWRKNEYLVPVMMILKALVEANDREICEGLVGDWDSSGAENTFLTDRVELLLRTYKFYGLRGKTNTRAYLGERFRVVLGVPNTMPPSEVGTQFLRKIVLPHLGANNVTESQDHDKFKMLLFMIRKLYALVAGDCVADNPDAVQHQEILLGGFLYGMIIKEKLDEWLNSIRPAALEWCKKEEGAKFTTPTFIKEFPSKVLARTNENIGGTLEYFLSTGNLVSPTGLDLQQVSGFTIVAEKINFQRFISHFRAVHRGSYFQELKTTTVRKLLPESWGFLCPVHTPDGSPCGLLNHFAHKCKLATRPLDVSSIPSSLALLGMSSLQSPSTKESLVVQLDGRIMGWCHPKQARLIADSLRHWKVEGQHGIPIELEIGYIPPSSGGQYPGIYLFSQQARMYRPVKYLPLDRNDFVGPLEQPYMSIACTEKEVVNGEDTHVEYHPTYILSILANMTPFSDFNQSPRNMYQCQMGKQSMGTPGTAIRYRTDDKIYRLQTGQTPIVRPPAHNEYAFDNFPNGMNSVVAVISYTGYDMDDAMIINKSAHERGFGHGTIYKNKKYDLQEKDIARRSSKNISKLFGFAPGGLIQAQWRASLDEDGLPYVGRMVNENDIVAAWHSVILDPATGELVNRDGITKFEKYRDTETAFVEEVRLIGSELGNEPCTTISIKYRVPRSPVVGDKFSSRHGQKGVCSQKWPAVDMPFSESGLQPDVIINPHAFPSRMTIGMFVESLAGKAGALHGLAQDSTPFRFDEDYTALDYFGRQLKEAGYNYHGNEPMYSGITGSELHADIYVGVVYYQRLRHMVNDKFQVRTTGPITALTGQPIKGRKRGGGIRFGEMERDSLLAHGTAYLLQDRLLNCSDYQRAWLCKACGSFLSTTPAAAEQGVRRFKGAPSIVRCRRCATRAEGWEARNETWEDASGVKWTGGDDTTVVAVPGVLKYLDVELAAMGVRLKFNVKP
ncbi:MAG: DNA-directed RNA polymerase I subunit RPA2 [Piccolia ochrophora]|nr:MAG: DNA-directed RNA polymerase I subunit RPA2 [Piccolia ochrophora]